MADDERPTRAELETLAMEALVAEQRVKAFVRKSLLTGPNWHTQKRKLEHAAEVRRRALTDVVTPQVINALTGDLSDAEEYIGKLRGPLLHYFGTTDPELLAEVWADQAKPVTP